MDTAATPHRIPCVMENVRRTPFDPIKSRQHHETVANVTQSALALLSMLLSLMNLVG